MSDLKRSANTLELEERIEEDYNRKIPGISKNRLVEDTKNQKIALQSIEYTLKYIQRFSKDIQEKLFPLNNK